MIPPAINIFPLDHNKGVKEIKIMKGRKILRFSTFYFPLDNNVQKLLSFYYWNTYFFKHF